MTNNLKKMTRTVKQIPLQKAKYIKYIISFKLKNI